MMFNKFMLFIVSVSEQGGFHQLADDVSHHDVALLNARGVGAGHVEQYVGEFFHCPSCLAGERNYGDAHFFGGLVGFEYVFGVARSGDAHQHVATFGGAAQQACEDVFVAVVVAHCGEVRCVAVQRLGVEWRTVEIETSRELGGKVLCVGGTATVATEVDFASVAQTFGYGVGGQLYAVKKSAVGEQGLLCGNALFYAL